MNDDERIRRLADELAGESDGDGSMDSDNKRVRDALEAAGAEEREWVESALVSKAPGEDAFHAELLRELSPPASSNSRLAAIAATLLLLVGGFFMVRAWNSAEPPSPPGPFMGDELQLVEPGHEASSFSEFEWTIGTSWAWFELYVYDATSEEERELASQLDLRDTRWSWSEVDTSDWPREIIWEVRAFDSSGELLESALRQSSLSSAPKKD